MSWWRQMRGLDLPPMDRVPDQTVSGAMRHGKKHGRWIETGWAGGRLECIYQEGVREGPYRHWHRDGFVSESGTFVAGHKHGHVESRSDTGQLRARYQYVEGQLDGPACVWAPDGSVEYQCVYRAGAIWSGTYHLRLVDAPHFHQRATYTDGHPVGLFETFDTHGVISLRAHYDESGRLDGAWTRYHPSGAPSLQGSYARGERVGRWQAYAAAGAAAEIDYEGDALWRIDGHPVQVLDDEDLERWLALVSAWNDRTSQLPDGAFELRRVIDAWPAASCANAVEWVRARRDELQGTRPRIEGYDRRWLDALLRSDDDCRRRLVDRVVTDHDHWPASVLARVVAMASTLRELALTEVSIDQGLESLFADGVTWPQLTHLSLHECGPLGTVPLRLAEATWAGALTSLSLDGDELPMSARDLAALLSSPHLTGVLRLGLSHGAWPAHAVRAAVASSPILARLESLSVRDAGDGWPTALSGHPTPALRHLEIWGSGPLPLDVVLGLASSARRPALETLALYDFDLPARCEKELAARRPDLRISL